MIILIRWLITAPILLLLAGTAQAQTCNFTMQPIDFGRIDPTGGGGRVTNVATLTATCSGTAGDRVRVCPRFGGGTGGTSGNRRLLRHESSDGTIGFTLFRHPEGQNWPLDPWSAVRNGADFDVPLSVGGTGSATLVVGAALEMALAQSPAGQYSSSFAGEDAVVTYAYASAGGCAQQTRQRAGLAPFQVRADLVPTCDVSASVLDFGDLKSREIAHDSSASLSIRCTAGTRYEVSLEPGTAVGGDPTRRRMMSGPNVLLYGTFRDPGRSLPWGSRDGSTAQAGIGTGRPETLVVYGRIPANQNSPPGRYTDTIVVSIRY
jgi:spore coat protein U-like protein